MKITKKIILVVFVFSIGFPLLVNAGQKERLIVDVAWLKEQNHSVIVDVRSPEEYKAGHIPGAVNIPVSETFNPGKNTDRVANSAHIQSIFSHAGITHDNIIILYDGGNHIDAGRVFWVFEVFGHEKVKLLSGGFPAWQSNPDNPVSQVIPEIKPSHYIPRLEPHRLTTKLGMQLALKDHEKIIIDARTKDEYLGKKSITSRYGHIPGALNIPWEDNLIKKNGVMVLKPVKELERIYNHVDKDKNVYLYCNKGKQSSLSYMVMRQLGYDVAHYDGSWFEWGNDELLPIEEP